MSQNTEVFQPKAVNWRTEDYKNHLQQVLGKLDWDTNFDNMFLKWKLVIQFIKDVREAIKQGVIPLTEDFHKELIPDDEAMQFMEQIWYGNVWLGVVKNQEETKILKRELFFEEPEPFIEVITDENGMHYATEKEIGTGTRYPREVILMPKLKDLLPQFEIKPDSWGITIKEAQPFRYAFEGVQYATIIKEGKYIHYLSDGEIPKFEKEDMKSMRLKSYSVSKPVYNAWMDILPRFFDQFYNVFQMNIQKIIKFLDDEDFDDDEMDDFGNMQAGVESTLDSDMVEPQENDTYF